MLRQAARLEQRMRSDVGRVRERHAGRRHSASFAGVRHAFASSGEYCRQRASTAPTRYNDGDARWHTSFASAHRAANEQPSIATPRSGGAPGMPVSSTRGPRIDGNASSSPRLYGCDGVSKTVRVGPDSTTWPAYMTSNWSEKWLTSDMSWVTKMMAKPSSRCSSLIWTINDR